MRIISFQAENFMRLSALYIEPTGNVIEISGKNRSGKTSTLSAIWAAVLGEKHIHAKPVRKGAKEAFIKLDLGTIKITRSFKAKENGETPTSLIVEGQDGAKFDKPQKVLNSLFGALSFDPLAFMRMKPEEQFDAMKVFVPGIDFDAMAEAHEKDFDERTTVNRQAKERRAHAAAIPIIEDAPAARIDDEELVSELQRAGDKNFENETERSHRAGRAGAAAGLVEKAVAARANARRLREEALAQDQVATEYEKEAAEIQAHLGSLEPLPDPIDTAALREQISAAGSHNRAFDNAVQCQSAREHAETEAADLEARSEKLTKAIDLRKAQIKTEVENADLPVKGIEFGEGTILFNGLPLDQASDAEQLRISVAIGAAMNPKLRVMTIHDGSLLDEDSMKLLEEFATASDLQVWIETVGAGHAGAIVLEDGHLKERVAEAAE